MPTKPEIINTTTIARTRLFSVEQLELRFSNGTEVSYERLVGSPHGAVLIVPMLDASTVLLVREYAAGVERYELTLPKGRIEAGEPIIEAANREIMEEIGYGAERLTLISSLTLAPGYFGHTTHVVLAEQLYERRLEGDEPEELEVVPWRLDQLDRLLQHEECTEARTFAALFLARERINHGN